MNIYGFSDYDTNSNGHVDSADIALWLKQGNALEKIRSLPGLEQKLETYLHSAVLNTKTVNTAEPDDVFGGDVYRVVTNKTSGQALANARFGQNLYKHDGVLDQAELRQLGVTGTYGDWEMETYSPDSAAKRIFNVLKRYVSDALTSRDGGAAKVIAENNGQYVYAPKNYDNGIPQDHFERILSEDGDSCHN